MKKHKKLQTVPERKAKVYFWKRPHPYLLLIIVFVVSWLFTLPVRSPELNAITPPPASPVPSTPLFGTTQLDVTYCYGQKMDLYGPRVLKYDRSPVVMYIHGGGWTINTKSTEPNQLEMIDGLRDKGYTIASIDYRLLPRNHFPAPLEDSLCAVRYLRAHADVHGIDSNRIALYGFSAGGYLAGMLGVLDTYNEFVPIDEPYMNYSSRVQAVVTLAGFFDLDYGITPRNRERITTFLGSYPPHEAEPVYFVTPDDPPFLLIHGADDQFVKLEQDDLMSQRLTAAGVYHEKLEVRGALHGLEPSAGTIQPTLPDVQKSIQSFIHRFLYPYED